jgi:hypothetical protein
LVISDLGNSPFLDYDDEGDLKSLVHLLIEVIVGAKVMARE